MTTAPTLRQQIDAFEMLLINEQGHVDILRDNIAKGGRDADAAGPILKIKLGRADALKALRETLNRIAARGTVA